MTQNDLTSHMQSLMIYAKQKNPVCPFASMILNQQGDVIIKAANASHISPLFQSEPLAIHMLLTKQVHTYAGPLTLISTGEPDPLSQSVIYWANAIHDLEITTIYYGANSEFLNTLLGMGIQIPAREIIERSSMCKISLIPLLEKACITMFQEAQKTRKAIDNEHPARAILSHQIDEFYDF